MKIIVAPDSFKGSLSAGEVVAAINAGIRRVSKKIKVLGMPLADGGEGLVEALVGASGGKILRKRVTGPLGGLVDARYGLIEGGKTGVIEMAAAAGLLLLSTAERNPLLATTYGVGELLKSAVTHGCKKIIIGAGGSATVDGGLGMLQALGVKFLDEKGKPVGRGGRELIRIHSMNTDTLARFVDGITFTVTVDVNNPLCGKQGAALVYGPQKGANPEMVRLLDKGLKHYADLIKRQLHKRVHDLSGAGAAGGLAAGAYAFLNAEIASGVGIVLEKISFEKKLIGCDLVITGEGRTDAQTLFGKAPLGVARLAQKHGVPVVCLSGGLGQQLDKLYDEGFTAFFSLVDGPLEESAAMSDAPRLLARASENIVRLFLQARL